MTNEELKTKITELIPAAAFEEGTEWLTVMIEFMLNEIFNTESHPLEVE